MNVLRYERYRVHSTHFDLPRIYRSDVALLEFRLNEVLGGTSTLFQMYLLELNRYKLDIF